MALVLLWFYIEHAIIVFVYSLWVESVLSMEVSRVFRCPSVHVSLASIQQSKMLSNEWCSSLKWAATRVLLYFLVFQSDRRRFIRLLSAMDVSPTYCLLQMLHVIRYTALAVLHVWRPFIAKIAPYIALNACAMGISLRVWQRVFLNGLDSPLGHSCLGVTFARTRMSLRLFGRLNATIGLSGKIRLSSVFLLMICQCLSMMFCLFGRSEIWALLKSHQYNFYVIPSTNRCLLYGVWG